MQQRGSGEGGEQPSGPRKSLQELSSYQCLLTSLPKGSPGLRLPPLNVAPKAKPNPGAGGRLERGRHQDRRPPAPGEHRQIRKVFHCTLTPSESDNLLLGITVSCLTQLEPG